MAGRKDFWLGTIVPSVLCQTKSANKLNAGPGKRAVADPSLLAGALLTVIPFSLIVRL